jgi:Tfp pilus assembly protein FimT
MQDKQAAGIFLEIFMIAAVLATLSAVALPRVGQMTNSARFATRVTEFQNIHTAVTQMLAYSESGTLEPVGPTADMGDVRTGTTGVRFGG